MSLPRSRLTEATSSMTNWRRNAEKLGGTIKEALADPIKEGFHHF